MGLPPFSSRNLTQVLEPIAQAANFRRTVNGKLVNLSGSQFTKYKSRISGSDQDTGAFDGIFPGQIVTVSCIQELSFLTGSEEGTRPAVDGAVRISGAYSFYRPVLVMMVTAGPTASWDEAAAGNTFSIDLEEV
jgi:hypothetical protein